MHKAIACPTGFKAIVVALSVLNLWLREVPLSAFANNFKFRCQSKPTDPIVSQNLSLVISPINGEVSQSRFEAHADKNQPGAFIWFHSHVNSHLFAKQFLKDMLQRRKKRQCEQIAHISTSKRKFSLLKSAKSF